MLGVSEPTVKILTSDEFDDVIVDVRRAARKAAHAITFGEGGEQITIESTAIFDIDTVLVKSLGLRYDSVYLPQAESLKWEYVMALAEERRRAIRR